MAKDFSLMEDSNRSSNPSIHEVSPLSRRTVLRASLGALAGGFFAPLTAVAAASATVAGGMIGFKSVPISTADSISVPEGYTYQIIAPWGDPVGMSGENHAF